jgi:hypothetical protein
MSSIFENIAAEFVRLRDENKALRVEKEVLMAKLSHQLDFEKTCRQAWGSRCIHANALKELVSLSRTLLDCTNPETLNPAGEAAHEALKAWLDNTVLVDVRQTIFIPDSEKP